MKKFLFEAITRHTYSLVWFSDRFFSVPVAFLLLLQAWAKISVSRFGFFFMKKLDPGQCALAEAVADSDPGELKRQDLELKLVASSYQIRDHAKETGEWTDGHTEGIEAIGNALLLEIGWEEEAVQQHMQSVVESIDGLEFDSWFEED